ncbi:Two-pore potassium channel 1 [Glycine max]|nr:Two-pore potassium channel 1 [Glycine max]
MINYGEARSYGITCIESQAFRSLCHTHISSPSATTTNHFKEEMDAFSAFSLNEGTQLRRSIWLVSVVSDDPNDFILHLSYIADPCFLNSSAVGKGAYMANNGVKEPLLWVSLDATQKTKQQLNKRSLLRFRSAPHAEIVPTETNGNESIPHSASIFQNLHPSFKRVAIYLAVYLGVGALIFYLVRNQIKGQKTDGILDALYFTIVTMTTVGYGDLVPNSHLTKLLACAFVFSGMALIGLIVSKAADYLVEKQELLLVKAMRMHQKVGSTEILREVQTNKTRYKLFLVFFLLLILIIAGTIFLVTVEKLDVIDAFYCVCSTITTLGYGDQSTITLAQLFLYIAELNTEIRQKELVKWVLTRKVTNSDLEAADLDVDGTVRAAEFVIYKLKEMGKISQEDISLVMQEFEQLDVDDSGTLSTSDITLAQSS